MKGKIFLLIVAVGATINSCNTNNKNDNNQIDTTTTIPVEEPTPKDTAKKHKHTSYDWNQ